jgi:hypothetical protein
MRRIRFHLGTMLLIVLLVGIGFAALRESNEIWDSSVFGLSLGVLLISILLAIHRTEKRRAYWLGFALFGSAYLGLSLVPSIESRLITTKVLAYLDSKVLRPLPRSVALYNILVGNNSQPDVFYVNEGDVTVGAMTGLAGSKPADKQVVGGGWISNVLMGPALAGSGGTTENFLRIGHSLFALIAALGGGLLSQHLHASNRQTTSSQSNPTNRSEPAEHLTGPSK